MTSFPTNFARIPTLQFGASALSNLEATNYQLFRVGQQLSTGRSILKPSDDAVKAAAIALLDARVERSEQIIKNLSYAEGSLEILDGAIGDASDLTNEALGIANEQIGAISSPEEREGQAVIVDSLLQSLFRISTRKSLVGYVFGGTKPGTPPVGAVGGAYRFDGERGGMTTDIGLPLGIPVTLGANSAVGALSGRVEGTVDLDPSLSLDTKLSDLHGARDLGAIGGPMRFSYDGSAPIDVDLTDATTIGDVVDTVTSAIRQFEADEGVTILGPGGISVSGGALTVDVDSGELLFSDLEGGSIAANLGLAFDTPAAFDGTLTGGLDLDPRLGWTSRIDGLNGLAGPLGSVRINNNAHGWNKDLSGAETLADLKSILEQDGTNVRVELNADGTGIDIHTEIAGTRDRAFSVAEVADGLGNTAEALGIRSLTRDTATEVLNEGRGVQVLSGAVDEDGNPAPEFDVDFVVTLGDGFEIEINLASGDVLTVGSTIDAMNAQIDAALTGDGRPTTDFGVSLSDSDNGLVLTQDPGIAGSAKVSPRNNSTGADQLGLLDLEPTGTGGQVIAADPGTVRVDNLFTALLDLSEALRKNDTFGIQLASDRLQVMSDSLAETRGMVGGFARRVSDETVREEERQVLDVKVRGELRDVDFAEAASRLALLQVQLQAGLAVAGQATRQTLLDFIG